MKNYTIALVGNPNSGKTTFFNALTGSNQHVGNWPGVTVEKKEGSLIYKNKEYNVIDLPGTYSLGAFSEDEVVAMDYVLSDDADVIINVVDASNIERNLYLTAQLLEMGKNVVIALNMVDEAEKRDIKFDLKKLSKELGVSVVATVANKGNGKDEILKAAVDAIEKKKKYENPLTYSENVKHHIEHMEDTLKGKNLPYPEKWLAIKIVEGDAHIYENLKKSEIDKKTIDEIKQFYKFHDSDSFELDIVDSRYAFANEVSKKAVMRPDQEVVTLTDKIDKLLINKYLGIPIFGLIMLAVFQITFVVGEDLLGGFAASIIEYLGYLIASFLVFIKAPGWLILFVTDGLINGVGAVVEFIPLITVMYLLLGFLEDSGYMARAAYVWDNLMRRFGMQGRAFILVEALVWHVKLS